MIFGSQGLAGVADEELDEDLEVLEASASLAIILYRISGDEFPVLSAAGAFLRDDLPREA